MKPFPTKNATVCSDLLNNKWIISIRQTSEFNTGAQTLWCCVPEFHTETETPAMQIQHQIPQTLASPYARHADFLLKTFIYTWNKK